MPGTVPRLYMCYINSNFDQPYETSIIIIISILQKKELTLKEVR